MKVIILAGGRGTRLSEYTDAIPKPMVEIGGMAIKTKSMSVNQNLICLAFGSGSLVWGVVIKFMPMKF